MKMFENVELDFKAGKVLVTVDLKSLIVPALPSLKNDVESGKIDPIKGTDLDKDAIVHVLDIIEKQFE